MNTPIKLMYTFITSQSYHFVCVARTFKIYSLSRFQVYNIVCAEALVFFLFHYSAKKGKERGKSRYLV